MKLAVLQHRKVSGTSTNTEKEEAMSRSFKTGTKLTSSFHSTQVVSNIIIRLQAWKILNIVNGDNKYKNSYLHAIYRSINIALRNSIISFEWIQKYSNKYQCLLEQQGGFHLKSSYWWSETDEVVTFLDYSETGRNLDRNTLHCITAKTTLWKMK